MLFLPQFNFEIISSILFWNFYLNSILKLLPQFDFEIITLIWFWNYYLNSILESVLPQFDFGISITTIWFWNYYLNLILKLLPQFDFEIIS